MLKNVFILIGILFFCEGAKTSELKTGDQGSSGQACRPLADKESKTLNEEWNKSPTGIERKYRITKEPGAKTFTVDLNIDFSPSIRRLVEAYGAKSLPSRDLVDYGSRDEAIVGYEQDRVRAQTRNCFESMKGRLTSSDGTVINLRLAFGETAKGIPPVPVEVNVSEHRSNSRSWAASIDCPTIIHEALHLMGLCDGYEEKWMPVSESDRIPYAGEDNQDKRRSLNRFDCRSVEPVTSVMRDPWAALGKKYSVMACPKSLKHHVQVESFPLSCPDGTASAVQTVDQAMYQRWVKDYGNEMTFYYSEVTSEHPLSPAQTRLIVNPGCEQQSAKYLECSGNAYKTRSMEGCNSVPQHCKNGDYLK